MDSQLGDVHTTEEIIETTIAQETAVKRPRWKLQPSPNLLIPFFTLLLLSTSMVTAPLTQYILACICEYLAEKDHVLRSTDPGSNPDLPFVCDPYEAQAIASKLLLYYGLCLQVPGE